MGRFDSLRNLAEALRHEEQSPETREKRGFGFSSASGVDLVDPPEDMSDYVDVAEDVGFIAAALDQFADDVLEPGVRVEADSDETAAFFNGGDDAPEGTPDDGFLSNAGIVGGERYQDFEEVAHQAVWLYEAGGNVLTEHVKDAEGENITGFLNFRPETVKLVTEDDRPILLAPDDTEAARESSDGAVTPRDEAAAYIQYHDSALWGPFDEKDEVPLSQNDVTKLTRNPRPGDLWGEAAVAAVAEEGKHFKKILSDLFRAIRTKAWGIWSVSFDTTVEEAGDEVIITEWPRQDQREFLEDKVGDDMGPGDIVGHDGTVSFEKFEGEVPDTILDVLETYVKVILARLPTPLYAVGFEDSINQFVVERQETRYELQVSTMRSTLEGAYTPAIREIAEQRELDTAGLRLLVEPEEDESPIRELDREVVEKIQILLTGFSKVGLKANDMNLEEFADLVAQLPEDAFKEEAFEKADPGELPPLDESSGEVGTAFEGDPKPNPGGDGGPDGREDAISEEGGGI